FGLEHADAESFLFCCLKGTKKRSPYKCGAHPASIVGHGQDCPILALIRLNLNLAPCLECLASIEKQVRDYTSELIAIHVQFWLRVKLLRDASPWRPVQHLKRVSNKEIKIHFCEFWLEGAQAAKPADKLVDSVCGFTDST